MCCHVTRAHRERGAPRRPGVARSVSVIAIPPPTTDDGARSGGSPDSGLGVGDRMWHALAQTTAEIVCVVDRNRREPELIDRLTRPLRESIDLLLVNGVYDQPVPADARAGDRLTELVARPLVRTYEPALSDCRQPMVHEFAARAAALRTLWFPVGAGIHLSLLVDLVRVGGRAAVTEVPIGRPRLDPRPLRTLGADACALIAAMRRRIGASDANAVERLLAPWDDLAAIYVDTAERPPLDRLPCSHLATQVAR